MQTEMPTTQDGEAAVAIVHAFNQLSTEGPVSSVALGHMHKGLAAAQHLCHGLSCYSGWWNNPQGEPIDPFDPLVFGTKMALIHSEASEAMEGGRKGLMDSHLPHRKAEEVELADLMIRVFDLAGARKMDLAGAIVEKLAYNQRRPDHKPEARAAAGGKVF